MPQLFKCYFALLLVTFCLPCLTAQQCQVVVTSDEAIRREMRAVLENLTEQINCIKDQLSNLQPSRPEDKLASSCASLLRQYPSTPSGYYQISVSGRTVRVYCDMTKNCGGITGGWTRVVSLDMGNSSERCPSPWRETSSPSRSCTSESGCQGHTFSSSGVTYSRVCGRAVGYAVRTPDAFADAFDNLLKHSDINGVYLDGISVTHGQPRKHIWSFAGGHDATYGHVRCPCDNANRVGAPLPPSFVGNNFFCDGEFNGALWDAKNCTTACCTANSPPIFTTTLPAPTADDIEVRLCTDQSVGDEQVNLRMIELYVQ